MVEESEEEEEVRGRDEGVGAVVETEEVVGGGEVVEVDEILLLVEVEALVEMLVVDDDCDDWRTLCVVEVVVRGVLRLVLEPVGGIAAVDEMADVDEFALTVVSRTLDVVKLEVGEIIDEIVEVLDLGVAVAVPLRLEVSEEAVFIEVVDRNVVRVVKAMVELETCAELVMFRNVEVLVGKEDEVILRVVPLEVTDMVEDENELLNTADEKDVDCTDDEGVVEEVATELIVEF